MTDEEAADLQARVAALEDMVAELMAIAKPAPIEPLLMPPMRFSPPQGVYDDDQLS